MTLNVKEIMLYKTIELNLLNYWFIDIFSSDTCSVSSVVRYAHS